MPSFKFETTSDEATEALKAQIHGKTVLITGASPNSLAAEAARAAASKEPALIILAGRNQQLNEETKAAILKETPQANIRLLQIDLASQSSVRKAAAEVNAYGETIDVLINSAGIMIPSYAKTPEGIESQFGVNHIGHFLFTNLIMGKIRDGGRIVNVTSAGYTMGGIRYDDINFEKEPYNKWAAYAQSKTGNVLFSRALARKVAKKHIQSFSVHPGAILTNIGKNMQQEDYDLLANFKIVLKQHPQGAATLIVAAFDPSIAGSNGGYMNDCQIEETPAEAPWAKGEENEEKMWSLSEELVGEKFGY